MYITAQVDTSIFISTFCVIYIHIENTLGDLYIIYDNLEVSVPWFTIASFVECQHVSGVNTLYLHPSNQQQHFFLNAIQLHVCPLCYICQINLGILQKS